MNEQLYAELFKRDNVHFLQVLVTLPLAALVGYVVSWVYRRTNRGFSYSTSFNITIIMTTIIISLIMITISSNIVLSLGLIGSLSIIRFRAVIKDTVDMVFLFWAIAEGLTIGAGNFVAGTMSVIIISGIVMLVSHFLFSRLRGTDYVVIAQLEPKALDSTFKSLVQLFEQYGLSWKLRSSELDKSEGTHEVVYQVDEQSSRVNTNDLIVSLKTIPGLIRASMFTSESNQFV